MKVYLAAPYGSRSRVAAHASALQAIGITVTSSWLAETHEINAGTQGPAAALTDQQVAEHAQTDFDEVKDCDLLVLFTAASVGLDGGGGRHVETGMAIALNKPVLVVGDPENVFHRIGPHRVLTFPDWPAVRDHLGGRKATTDALRKVGGVVR